MAKIIKICLIFLLMTGWIYSGWPQIWKNPAFPPEIQEAYALTETKTWVFTGDTEGLADAADSAFIDFTHDTTDDAVNFFMNKKNKTNETEYARKVTTGDTWETWNVPSGATVTAVQITAWQEKTVNNTGLTSHTISARIIGSGETTVHNAGDLLVAVDLGTGTDGDYVSGVAGLERAIDVGSQASTTDVRLELQYVVTTSASPNINQRLDTIELTITYTPVAAVSISITNEIVAFQTVALDITMDNSGDLPVITVDSGPANLNVKSTVFTEGGNTWTLDETNNGPNQVLWEFSKNGTEWAPFIVAGTEYAFDTNVPTSGTRNLYLRLTTPTETDSYDQYSSTVTVVASAP